MNKPKFTEGPWIIVDGQVNSDVEITTVGRQEISKKHICEMDNSICEMDIHFHGRHGVEQRANAHLIAAAPEMYKEVERIANLLDELDKFTHPDIELDAVAHHARQILAKARGEV